MGHFLTHCEWLNNKILANHLEQEKEWILHPSGNKSLKHAKKIAAFLSLVTEFKKRDFSILAEHEKNQLEKDLVEINAPNVAPKNQSKLGSKLKNSSQDQGIPKAKKAPEEPKAGQAAKVAKENNDVSTVDSLQKQAIPVTKLQTPKPTDNPLVVEDSDIQCLIKKSGEPINSTTHACIIPSENFRKYLAVGEREKNYKDRDTQSYTELMFSAGWDLRPHLTEDAAQQSTAGIQNKSTPLEYCLVFKMKGESVDKFLKQMTDEFGVASKNYCINLARTNQRFANHLDNWTMFKTTPTGSGSKPHSSALKPFAYGFKDGELLIAPPKWAPQFSFGKKISNNELEIREFWKDRPLGGFFFSKEMLPDILEELNKWEAYLK